MMYPKVRLSTKLIPKYLEKVPDSSRDKKYEEQASQLSSQDEQKKTELIAGHYCDIIETHRKDDLKRFLRLLREDIPDDYVLDRAREILLDVELNTFAMDYDDSVISRLDEVIECIDSMGTILKAKRQGFFDR
ncbi:hypothetical protein [Nitrosopumilus sp.]|uniref:hypothetical protein n=1 Tax=Nitrosopumilus sp. TaxID=2024843 RepID=UPI003B59B897